MSQSRRVFVEIPHRSPEHTRHTVLPSSKTMKRKLTGDENLHSGSTIVARAFDEDTAPSTPSKKSRIEVALHAPPPSILTSSVTIDANVNGVQPSSPRAPPVKISHCPSWKPIPDCFDRDRVELHAFLREFAHRFYQQLGLAKVHLDALNTFEPITEPTCKGMLAGLLNVIYEDESSAGSRKHSQKLSEALKQLRKVKSNPDAWWNILQGIKDCFTTPLAQPMNKDTVDDSLMRRATRTGPQELIHPSQLMPVLISLCEEALYTSAIRQELDDGVKEATQLNRERISHAKEETEKWDVLRAEFKQHKENAKRNLPHDADWHRKSRDARAQYQNTLKGIIVKYRTEIQGRNLRFAPLGIDHEGRVYYALSQPRPITLTVTKKSKGRLQKRESLLLPTVPTSTGRARFSNWAYFIFVWGRKPAGEGLDNDLTSQPTEPDDGVDEDTVRWWGFSESGEVRKLSKWIFTTAQHMDESAGIIEQPIAGDRENTVTPRTSMSSTAFMLSSSRHVDKMRPLCKGLDEFADFLEVCFGEG